MERSSSPAKVLRYLLKEAAKSRAFLRRDFRIEFSYRFSFLNQIAEIFFSCSGFYFLNRFVGQRLFPDLGTDYFSFILIGVAFFDYMTVSLTSYAQALSTAQTTGTFEQLLVTQTGVGTLVWGGSLYYFLATTIRALAYLGLGVGLFGLRLSGANLPGAVTIAALSILAFSGVGILSAAIVVLFKRGNPFNWLLVSASWLIGGVLYPVRVLPGWVQKIAHWNPLNASLDALRATLLKGTSLIALGHQIGLLAFCTVTILPASLLLFWWAVEQAKISGTLSDY